MDSKRRQNYNKMKIGCTGNYFKSDFFQILSDLIPLIKKTGNELFLSTRIQTSENQPFLKGLQCYHMDELIEKCDIMLSIGGDGTIL